MVLYPPPPLSGDRDKTTHATNGIITTFKNRIVYILTGLSVANILEECCVIGTNWGTRGEECNSYPSLISGVSSRDQRDCKIILEVCCTKERQQSQCELGKVAALDSQSCVIRQDEFGSEQYMVSLYKNENTYLRTI